MRYFPSVYKGFANILCHDFQLILSGVVKQDLFITDVNTCVAALKKLVQDMHQNAAADKNLMLTQASARYVFDIYECPGLSKKLQCTSCNNLKRSKFGPRSHAGRPIFCE
jgi:hypothetical protein